VEVGAERAKVCEEGEGEEVKSGLGVQLFIVFLILWIVPRLPLE
jgi:hypothetical protein